jgi:hypothetical protein
VVYRMGGNENQYDPALTRLPVKYSYDGSRADWKTAKPASGGDVFSTTLQYVVRAIAPAAARN